MLDAQGLLSAASSPPPSAGVRAPHTSLQCCPTKASLGRLPSYWGECFRPPEFPETPKDGKCFISWSGSCRCWTHQRCVLRYFGLPVRQEKKIYINSIALKTQWNLRSHMPFTLHFGTLGFYSVIQRVKESLRIETLRMAACWQYFSRGQVLWPFLFWEPEAEGAMRPPRESRAFQLVLFPKLFGHFSYVLGQTGLILFSFQGHCTYGAVSLAARKVRPASSKGALNPEALGVSWLMEGEMNSRSSQRTGQFVWPNHQTGLNEVAGSVEVAGLVGAGWCCTLGTRGHWTAMPSLGFETPLPFSGAVSSTAQVPENGVK